jgi:phosphoesterase RecJ-like protein
MTSVADRIRGSERIAVLSHIRPDGDAVGSTIALSRCLTSLGKSCVGVLTDGIPSAFSYLANPDELRPELPRDLDLCIVLDAPDTHRTGQDERILEIARQGNLILIDHHPKGNLLDMSAASIHQTVASSTAELVYGLISDLGGRLTPDIATALLTGIFTDTGGFQHPNTTSRTMEIAAELMRRGGRLNLIVQEVFHTKSLAALRLLGIALGRLRLVKEGACAVSVITNQEIQEAGATENDLLGIIGSMNDLPGIQFSLLLTEPQPGVIRGALRSGDRHSFNVGRLARPLGGGGHPRAAGFVIPGSLSLEGATWSVIAPREKTS